MALWNANYEEGEVRGPDEDWPERTEPFGSFLLGELRKLGDRVVQVYPKEGVEWRASDLADRAEALAFALKQELGVEQGQRVCFLSACHPQYAPLLLGLWLLGGTMAPINPAFSDADLEHLLRVVQPAVVLCESCAQERVRSVLRRAGAGDAQLLLLGEGDAWGRLEERAAAAPAAAIAHAQVTDLREAIAALMCSSGTSGFPKCVIYTHAMLHAVFYVLKDSRHVIKPDDNFLFGSGSFWMTHLLYNVMMMGTGLKMILMYGSTEDELLAAIETYKVTCFFLSSNVVVSMAKIHSTNPKYDLSSLRFIGGGGSPLGPDLEKFLEDALGCQAQQVYGMTELSMGIGLTERSKRKYSSVNTLVPNFRCKIVDPETGKILGRNQPGELRFKCPTMSPGYLGNPEATADLYDEKGWLKSGDIGYADEDGYFFVTGRIKDIIKYKGYQMTPTEMESILNSHPDVMESVVLGVPNPATQELPRAYVVLREGATVTEEELIKLVEDQVVDYKRLRGGVEFVDKICRTGTGKVNRPEMRKKYGLDKMNFTADDIRVGD